MPTSKQHSVVAYPAGQEGLRGTTASPDVEVTRLSGLWAARCTSVHGHIELPRHPFSRTRGHLTLWICPVEELSQHPIIWRTGASNKVGHTIPLVTDEASTPETEAARFSVFWQPSWSHPFFVKFARGRFFPDMHDPEPRFFIEGWIATLRRHHWYRIDLAFDHERAYHALWLNGILAGRSNQQGRAPASFEQCGPRLFLRSPQIAYGSVELYPRPMPEELITDRYKAEAPAANHAPDEELTHALTGSANPRRFLQPEEGNWTTVLNLDLCHQDQASRFHLQGCPDCLHWDPEGLRVLTPQETPFAQDLIDDEKPDLRQMYLWSEDVYEGDLYIAFDFMPLQHGGLVILIPRASGMQGEDFLTDYPPRVSGSMKLIHSSDVRLYHWEFFREMDDVRNDVPTHAIVKWPWERVLATGVSQLPFHFREWNRVEFLQRDEHFHGAVNGEVVIQGHDTPYAGSGPVLRHGRFAIRYMVRTDARLRNLVVKTTAGIRQV